MNWKKIAIIAFVGIAIALTGCIGDPSTQSGEELAQDTGTDTGDSKIGDFSSYWYEIKLTESNQYNLVQKRPPIQMEDSLERANLIRRYEYLNDKDNMHHVYLMSNDGKVISYFVAEGKVSSVNSKLTNDRQVVRIPGCEEHNSGNDCWKIVESPQMDGSYGENGAAIFFFTNDGRYVEWNGKYVASEKPLNIQTAVSLEHEVSYDGGDVDNSSISAP